MHQYVQNNHRLKWLTINNIKGWLSSEQRTRYPPQDTLNYSTNGIKIEISTYLFEIMVSKYISKLQKS